MILQQHPNFHRCPHYKEFNKEVDKASWFWIGVQIFNYNKKWEAAAAAEPKVSGPFEIDCSSDDNSTNTQNQASPEAFIPPVMLEAPAAGSEVALLPLDEPAAGADASIPLPEKKNRENEKAPEVPHPEESTRGAAALPPKGKLPKEKKPSSSSGKKKVPLPKKKPQPEEPARGVASLPQKEREPTKRKQLPKKISLLKETEVI
jgi:hypothetical protein